MIGLSVILAILAFVGAHAAILVQFIGSTDNVLLWLSVVQFACISGAILVLVAAGLYSQKTSSVAPAKQPADTKASESTDGADNSDGKLPPWLIFLCVLLIATVLLGEIAILIARMQGNELSLLQHVPTLTVFCVCAVFCKAWKLANRTA